MTILSLEEMSRNNSVFPGSTMKIELAREKDYLVELENAITIYTSSKDNQ